jgi:hypothetical protein
MYLDNSIRVILQTLCQIERTSSSLRYVNCGHGHIQSIFSSRYSGRNIQLIVPALLLEISRQLNKRYTATMVRNTGHIVESTLCELWTGHIQSISSSAYLGSNIQLNVSALPFEIIGHNDARYTANLEPNIAHIIRFTLCGLWSCTYTKYLQLLIVRPQYSTEPDCAATTDMPTFGCALYCNLGGEYSAPSPVYAMCTVVPDIYKVFTAPHIQAAIFN